MLKTLLCLIILLFPLSGRAVEIQFRSLAVAKTDQLVLGEAAEIKGSPAEREWLQSQPVSRAPAVGEKLQLARRPLQEHLIKEFPGLAKATWKGPSELTLTRASRKVNTRDIRALLENYLATERHTLPPGKISLEILHLPKPFDIPLGRLQTQIIPGNPDLLRNRSFSIIYQVDNRVIKNLTVRTKLHLFGKIYCASRALERGAIITPTDLTTVEQELNTLRNPIFTAEMLVGKRLLRSMQRGAIFSTTQIEEPPLVKRGEQVLILARRGHLKITAHGTARRKGLLGQTIPVKNSATQKDILAVVAGSGLVQVEF